MYIDLISSNPYETHLWILTKYMYMFLYFFYVQKSSNNISFLSFPSLHFLIFFSCLLPGIIYVRICLESMSTSTLGLPLFQENLSLNYGIEMNEVGLQFRENLQQVHPYSTTVAIRGSKPKQSLWFWSFQIIKYGSASWFLHLTLLSQHKSTEEQAHQHQVRLPGIPLLQVLPW